jgi:hypothetical protein
MAAGWKGRQQNASSALGEPASLVHKVKVEDGGWKMEDGRLKLKI